MACIPDGVRSVGDCLLCTLLFRCQLWPLPMGHATLGSGRPDREWVFGRGKPDRADPRHVRMDGSGGLGESR